MSGYEEDLYWLRAEREITRAFNNYCHALDRNDVPLLLSAFHPDATLRMGNKPFVGHAEIGSILDSGFLISNHFSTNHQISHQGPTTASGTSHVFVSYVAHDGQVLSGSGNYRDIYELRDGHWRISSRKVELLNFAIHQIVDSVVRPEEEWLTGVIRKQKPETT